MGPGSHGGSKKRVQETRETARSMTGQAPLLAACKHGGHVNKAHTHNWISCIHMWLVLHDKQQSSQSNTDDTCCGAACLMQ
jgi:hypothetical protein